MSLGGVLETLQQGLASKSGQGVFFPTDQDFASKLTVGQILKGKVMRHYEGKRYGISFSGQEKVVDSTIPLRVGDALQARVQKVNEKVHLQRLVGEGAESVASPTAETLSGPAKSFSETIAELFAQHQLRLSPEENALLTRWANTAGNTSEVARWALLAGKQGLRVQPDLVEALSRFLQTREETLSRSLTNDPPAALQLLGPQGGPVDRVSELVALIKGLAANPLDAAFYAEAFHATQSWVPGGDTSKGFAEEDAGADWCRKEKLVGKWLLNAQSEGSVAHRYLHLPLWFGDHLVEVELAFFSQLPEHKRSEGTLGSLHYRKALFSLQTQALGRLEGEVLTAERHLRLQFVAETIDTAEWLGQYLPELKSGLEEVGWIVDEIRYDAREVSGGPLRSVVEYQLAPDSLSRLM